MTPTVKEIFHPEYGKCVHVIAGPVTALVTIDKGPGFYPIPLRDRKTYCIRNLKLNKRVFFIPWAAIESPYPRSKRPPTTRITSL